MRYIACFLLLFFTSIVAAQQPDSKPGVVIGSILDADNSKALADATVKLILVADSARRQEQLCSRDGEFMFDHIAFGYYRLRIDAVGYASRIIDSIHIRADRFDFDLHDIRLSKNASLLSEVTIYAEKPLIENKDGKLTFNVGESALSSGSTATELLKQTPLVNVDNDGKVLLRGKEVKVLIDDKPVELDAKQLQDLMESMPGSMIEKIEVMTTPPPQYANERGGVINIVTKKGKVGFNARVNVNYGTRGEAGVSGNLGYRKNKLSLNVSAGFGYNEYVHSSFSNRENKYTDSVNFFGTTGESNSFTKRPNFRANLGYDLNKRHSLGFSARYNSNNSANENETAYRHAWSNGQLYKLSDRGTITSNQSYSPAFDLTYSIKGKDPREVLKFISAVNINYSETGRDFFQQYFNPDYTPTGADSSQQQFTSSANSTTSLRINYDKPLKGNKFSLNLGANGSRYRNHQVLTTVFLKKPEQVFVKNELMSNDFVFHQHIYALRAAMRYDIVPDFFINAGLQAEHTETYFDLADKSNRYANNYWTPLPFFTLMKKWKNEVSITASYKRTIQRPRLNELNPGIDYSDPYNTRSGNPYLQPYYADNVDLIVGKWNKLYFVNGSVGYNVLQNIYSFIRTLNGDGTTFSTWQNISGRKEYEASAWGGYTFDKKAKANLSVGYTYNAYSLHDRTVRRFRNGGSLYSTLNGSYQFTDLLNANASFTFNRFANPQGTVRNNLSMNIGAQRKLFDKRFIVTVNVIDPFLQQENRNETFGPNFYLLSSSTTNTRNYRLALAYVFKKNIKKSGRTELLKKLQSNKA